MDRDERRTHLSALRMLAASLDKFHGNEAMKRHMLCSVEAGEDVEKMQEALRFGMGILEDFGFMGNDFTLAREEIPADQTFGFPGFAEFRLVRSEERKEVFKVPCGAVALMEAIRKGMTGDNYFTAWMLDKPKDDTDIDMYWRSAGAWLVILQEEGILPQEWQIVAHPAASGGVLMYVGDEKGKRLPFEGEDPLLGPGGRC